MHSPNNKVSMKFSQNGTQNHHTPDDKSHVQKVLKVAGFVQHYVFLLAHADITLN